MDDPRLRPEDLANLWVEDRCTPFHIAVVAEFDGGPFTDRNGRVDLERVRAALAARVHRVPELTRRMVAPRFRRPVWAPDAGPGPEPHIRCSSVPEGRTFLSWAADRIVQPIDRAHALWRAEVVGGLPGGRFGLIVVVHHVVADGLAGVAMITRLLDERPDMSAADLPAHADRQRPTRSAPGHRRSTDALAGIRDALADFRRPATRTTLPVRVGPGRRLAAVEEPLDDLRQVGSALRATINDLLLAGVTGGLRRLLADELRPGLALLASVPVGRTGAGQTAGMLAVALPLGEEDPLRRLASITRETTAGKDRVRDGTRRVMDVVRLPLPLARLGVRWMRRMARGRINLFVTDVPGPPATLWLAGARMVRAVPVAPLVQGVPLGVAALSYAGRLHVAANADAGVTGLDRFTEGMRDEFAVLAAAARAGTTAPGERIPVGAERPGMDGTRRE
jgi:WS/DGAT/MGAT family acyltransferase